MVDPAPVRPVRPVVGTGAVLARSEPCGRLRLVDLPERSEFVDLIDVFCRLRLLERWSELRLLLSDDARIESVAARGVAGPGETVEAMRFASAGESLVIDDYEIEALGDQAALVRVGVRRSRREGGELELFWLVTGEAGLIRRARLVVSAEDAQRILADEGAGIGL